MGCVTLARLKLDGNGLTVEKVGTFEDDTEGALSDLFADAVVDPTTLEPELAWKREKSLVRMNGGKAVKQAGPWIRCGAKNLECAGRSRGEAVYPLGVEAKDGRYKEARQ